jgi:thioredoxin 1
MDMSNTIRTTDKDFDNTVIKSESPVLVDFWASWCTPCKMSEPTIDELANKYDGKVKVVKLNVDQNPKTAERYQIMGLPTYILFNSGEEIERKIGAQSKEQLMRIIDPLL